MTAFLFALAANDSSVVGVGGAVTSFDPSTPVRMLRESVTVDYAKAAVTTEFVFENPGPTTTVTMGFPEEGWGDIGEPGRSWFRSFKSWVDGKEVKTELWPDASDDGTYKFWWTKEVGFPAGRERRVRNDYTTRHGGNVEQVEWLTYVLRTGAPWAGTIGRAKVVFDVSGIPDGTVMSAHPMYHRRSGDLLVWEWHDFEPTTAHDVTVFHAKPGAPVFTDPEKVLQRMGKTFKK
jgi:hypothetical protein